MLDSGTRLAVDRTRLAHERTLMAWVRTAASLISFGFAVYKFFELDARNRDAGPHGWLGPRGFAMMMISIGLVALLLSAVQHHQSLRAWQQEYGDAGVAPYSTAGIVAGLFSLLGIIALVVVFQQ